MAEGESTGLSPTVVWCSGSDGNYREKAEPYLRGLVEHGIKPVMHFTVDYDMEELASRQRDITKVEGVIYMPLQKDTFRAPSPINCLQHGDFLQAIPAHLDPTIVFTDCDIVVQRDISEGECKFLNEWPENTIGVVYNNGEGDSLLHEMIRLGPKLPLDQMVAQFEWPLHPMYMPCFNTGVFVARRSAYEKIYHTYCTAWPMVEQLFTSYAKQQWLLSYLIVAMGFNMCVLPETFHTHGCFNTVRPVPARYKYENDVLTVNKDVVLLRHNWMVS